MTIPLVAAVAAAILVGVAAVAYVELSGPPAHQSDPSRAAIAARQKKNAALIKCMAEHGVKIRGVRMKFPGPEEVPTVPDGGAAEKAFLACQAADGE